jgi:hypothetical protein
MAQTVKPGETATITTPDGTSFDAHGIENGAILFSTAAGDGNTIVVQGDPSGGTAEFDILGTVGDGIMAVLKAAKNLLGCTMTTTTTVNVSGGQVTSIVTTTTCAS